MQNRPYKTVSWSSTVAIIVAFQLAAIVLLGASYVDSLSQGFSVIGQLPPFVYLYATPDVMWLGSGRIVAHFITAILNIMIAGIITWYAINRKVKIIRYATVAMAIQLFVSAVVNLSMLGALAFGGWWHVVALSAVLVMTVVATATTVILIVVVPRLRDLGALNDTTMYAHLEEDQ